MRVVCMCLISVTMPLLARGVAKAHALDEAWLRVLGRLHAILHDKHAMLRMKDLFRQMDKDKSGTLSLAEFEKCLLSFSRGAITKEECELVVS